MAKITSRKPLKTKTASKNRGSECGSEKCAPSTGRSKGSKKTTKSKAKSTAKKSTGKRKVSFEGTASKKQKQDSITTRVKLITTRSTVKEIKQALDEKGIAYTSKDLKVELLAKLTSQEGSAQECSGEDVSEVTSKDLFDALKSKKLDSIKTALNAFHAVSKPSFNAILHGVVAALKGKKEADQVEVLRILLQNVSKMHVNYQDNEVFDEFNLCLEPDAEALLWCILVAIKKITSWDELLTELGHVYCVEDDGSLESFGRYLEIVDCGHDLRKQKLLSSGKYEVIITNEGAYQLDKAGKKNQKATWEVLKYLFDEEDRFEEDTWDQLEEHAEHVYPITDDARTRINNYFNLNADKKQNPVSNTGAEHFYGAEQFYLKNNDQTNDQLREECEKRGLTKSGNKKELLARLRTYENQYNQSSDSEISEISDSEISDSDDSIQQQQQTTYNCKQLKQLLKKYNIPQQNMNKQQMMAAIINNIA